MTKVRLTVQQTATVIVDKKWSIALSGDMIIELLREAGHNIPDDATVTFQVPGGGDWSNMEIAVDQGSPVEVSWTSHIVETKVIGDEPADIVPER